jgi:predicted small lipoprotein YifL
MTATVGRGVSAALALLILALSLAACGKKAAPEPPPGVPNTFPRTYPSQ